MSSTSVLDSTPEDISIVGHRITIRMSDGSEVSDDLSRYERLSKATPEQRQNWQWTGLRDGIHWPDVDEDLSVHGIIRDDLRRRDSMRSIPFLIADLLRITDQLSRLFPGRKFTPDGHLVGSIGEVVAQFVYDLKLEPCSTPGIDARTADGRTVQIKLTGSTGKSFGMRWSNVSERVASDILIALKLDSSGFAEVYNGPFPTDLLAGKPDQKNGQIPLSVSQLRPRNPSLLQQVNPLAEFNKFFQYELDSAA